MTSDTPAPDPAKARFFMLSGLRLAGALMIMAGVVIVRGAVTGLPVPTGYVLLALGLGAFLALPRLLARRWKSPVTEMAKGADK